MSVWQLLLRPGHIISDYIDGKRQVSFPPVKMLFIIVVIYCMVAYWLIPEVLGISYAHSSKDIADQQLGGFVIWEKKNFSWFELCMAVLAVLPTWIMFRFAPRHSNHSLPEGFFIQIFLMVIIIVLHILTIPLDVYNSTLGVSIFLLLIVVYYFIIYKYLFGYGIWGTLWRSGFVMATILCLMMSALFLAFNIDMNSVFKNSKMTEAQSTAARYSTVANLLVTAIITLTVGFAINYIFTRKSRRELKQKAS